MTVLNSISKTGKALPFNQFPEEYIFYALPGETTSLFYGIEAETEGHYPGIIPFLKSDFIFTSYEGSVYQGLEFKNHPATFRFLKKNKIQWQRILRQKTLKVTEACGMHIHLSISAFDDELLFRFIKFIYGNPVFTFAVSERTKNTFSAWCGLGGSQTDIGYQSLAENIRKSYNQHSKGSAITGNMHGETVELRIFAGTLDSLHFWKNLEFCDCVYYFCKYVNSSKDITVSNFYNYLFCKKLRYRNLYKFLVEDVITLCV